jgi:hypothetical protein
MTASKKEELLRLIDNQIDYWNKVKMDTLGQGAHSLPDNFPDVKCGKCGQLVFGGYDCPCAICLHESDGKRHLFNDDGGNFFMNKCIKCAKFYK